LKFCNFYNPKTFVVRFDVRVKGATWAVRYLQNNRIGFVYFRQWIAIAMLNKEKNQVSMEARSFDLKWYELGHGYLNLIKNEKENGLKRTAMECTGLSQADTDHNVYLFDHDNTQFAFDV